MLTRKADHRFTPASSYPILTARFQAVLPMLFRRKKPSGNDSELNPYEIWQAQQAEKETAEIAEIEREKSGKGYLRWLNPVTYIGGFWSSLLDDNRREAMYIPELNDTFPELVSKP